jgi:hypothetical protein
MKLFAKPEKIIEGNGEFYSQLNDRFSNLYARGANCFGTALYLAGEVSCEKYMSRIESEGILEGLKEINNPLLGSIIGWVDKDFSRESIYHLGVITQEKLRLVTNREGANGPLRINESFRKTNRKYSIYAKKREIRYFVPKKLEHAIWREFYKQ